MHLIANWFTKLNQIIGKTVSGLSVILIAVIVIDVSLRYLFSITSAASFELEWHLFSALFLLTAGWTFSEDRHVRVDVFYQRFSEKQKAWVNLLGCLFFLLPFCIAGFVESLPFVRSSFNMGETSPDPGGLPARWIVKSMIPTAFLLLGLQCFAGILSSLEKILQK